MVLRLEIFSLVCLFVTSGICRTPDFDFDVEAVIKELLTEQNKDHFLKIKHDAIRRSLIKSNYDPDLYLNTTELIRSKGYTCEEHIVETEDGFVLGLQRILPKRKSLASPTPVVFLQHGLLDSSSTWVINHANQSLGYLLSDAGCDVWLGNVRGNTYSRRHKKLNPRNKEFWNWSWDEMAKYDIPAMVGYISNVTSSRNITYVGHSQGTLVAFASLSRSPELQQVVTKFFALAPVAVLGNIRGFLKYLAKFVKIPQTLFSLLGVGEFMPSNPLVTWIADNLCPKVLIRDFCATIILMGGLSENNTNMTRIPVYVSHEPSGTSVKNMVHFAQLVNSKKFQMYDYSSSKENMKHYNQTKPPLYNLRDITVPTYIFYGGQDELSTPKDSEEVIKNITNLAYVEEIPHYEHMDFIWGFRTVDVIYNKIINFIFAT